MDELDVVVVVAVDHEPSLDVVMAAPLGRQVQLHAGLDDPVARRSRFDQDGGVVLIAVEVGRLGVEAQPRSRHAPGRGGRGADPAPLRPRSSPVELVRGARVRGAREVRLRCRDGPAAGLSCLGRGSGLPAAGGSPPAAANRRPAVHPVERVELRGALREADRAREVRIVRIHRVEDRPVLTVQVGEDGVVARSEPAVAAHAEHRRASDAAGRERGTLPVHERACRACRATDEHGVAGQRPPAAVGRGGEEVVEAAVLDDLRPLVAGADGHARGRRGGGAQPVGGELPHLDAPVVASVIDVALPLRARRHVRIYRRVEAAAGARAAWADDGASLVGPRSRRVRARGDADGAVLSAVPLPADRLLCVGDGVVEVVFPVEILDLRGPETRPRFGPRGRRGKSVAGVSPVDEVGGAEGRDLVVMVVAGAILVPVSERIARAVHIPVRVSRRLASDHGRVGAALDGLAGGGPDVEGVGAGRGRCEGGGEGGRRGGGQARGGKVEPERALQSHAGNLPAGCIEVKGGRAGEPRPILSRGELMAATMMIGRRSSRR